MSTPSKTHGDQAVPVDRADQADQAIVELDGVSVHRGHQPVLEDISFELPSGQFLGLVGPNGAGKTTLLKAILGLVPTSAGDVRVFGRAATLADRDTHSIGYVPQRQRIPENFPATVRDVVMMGRLCCIGQLGFPSRDDWQHVERTLELVSMTDRQTRPVGALSGGEQRRVLLAQALCASTRLLVLDEPTIGLDLPAEHEFYELLRRLQSELGLTIVAVSHDLLALAGEADRLICINRRMHVHGKPDDVIHSHAIREAYSCEFDFIAGELAHHSHDQPSTTAADEPSTGKPPNEGGK